jgi:hypothetical protein
MFEERIKRVLPLMFHCVKINELAKANLRRKLFGALALTDDDLGFVAAAGDLTKRGQKEADDKDGED